MAEGPHGHLLGTEGSQQGGFIDETHIPYMNSVLRKLRLQILAWDCETIRGRSRFNRSRQGETVQPRVRDRQ